MVFVEPPAEFILNKDKYFIHCQCTANGHRINWYTFLTMNYLYLYRADSRFAPSQWETSLQSNAVSHWLGSSLESALLCICASVKVWQKTVIFVHYTDVIMTTMASQITSLTVVYSTIYSDADQRKRQNSASLALCGEFIGTGEFPAQRASYAEYVSIWWRHHVWRWLHHKQAFPASCKTLLTFIIL